MKIFILFSFIYFVFGIYGDRDYDYDEIHYDNDELILDIIDEIKFDYLYGETKVEDCPNITYSSLEDGCEFYEFDSKQSIIDFLTGGKNVTLTQNEIDYKLYKIKKQLDDNKINIINKWGEKKWEEIMNEMEIIRNEKYENFYSFYRRLVLYVLKTQTYFIGYSDYSFMHPYHFDIDGNYFQLPFIVEICDDDYNFEILKYPELWFSKDLEIGRAHV